MKTILVKKKMISLKKILFASFWTLLLLFFLPLTACKKSVKYYDYVSELRNNIFLYSNDELSLRVFSSVKEVPYDSDGIKRECSPRTEFFLTAPSGDKSYILTFVVNGKEYGGELSFDNVKAEYYYSCSLDTSSLKEISCKLQQGESEQTFSALSVLTEKTLQPKAILQNLVHEEKELFDSMTDKYGFAGEIYLRLLFEDAPFYYVGVINRQGNVYAFLFNAETGKLLAKRQS